MTMIERVPWTCPICERRYAIPATAPTPTRCPACREAEQALRDAAERQEDQVEQREEQDEEPDSFETRSISPLAAIQLEVAEEAIRSPVSIPAVRHNDGALKTLQAISGIFTVLAGAAVVAALGALLYGFYSAIAMPAAPARRLTILSSIAGFGGGLLAGLLFFTIREVIRLLLAIDSNLRDR